MKKSFLQDENALSEVLGFVLIMGILLSATTIYLSIQTPEWTKDYESRHADEVADDFSEQDSLIDGIVLIAQRGGEIAAGTTPIKMSPDKVPIFGMSPPGSSLNSLPDDETFVITPYVGTLPPPATVYNFSWVESTTDDFENGTEKPNVDVNFDRIKLLRIDMVGELIIDNTTTSLSDEVYHYDKIEIRNSTVYLVPNAYRKLYANTIFIDSTSTIIADDCGSPGGGGGKFGSGAGFGRYGYNGSGGGGAGYGGDGGDGGLGGYSKEPDPDYENDAGICGSSYGDNSSLSFILGSGGGGGGCGEGSQGVPHQGAVGGTGGNGGGAVLLDAPQIRILGTISANGAAGSAGFESHRASGGGGGGSGGTILIRSYEVNLSSATLSAKGGDGGAGGTVGPASDYAGGGGGGGAGGRIKIFYDNASLYDNPSQSPSVNRGIGGAGYGGGNHPGDSGIDGSNGIFYENQTAYISGLLYEDEGHYVSRVFDTGNDTTCYGNMTWEASTNEYTSIVMKVRTSISPVMDDYNATMWVNCDAVANGQDISGLNSAFDWHQYVQYRVDLSTYDTTMTPVLYEVCINYSSSNPAGGSPVVAESSGILKFNSHYLYYPNQEIVYEHGAVIKCQGKGEGKTGFMLHPPPIEITNESGGVPTIRISMIDLIGSDHSYSGSTTTSVENSYTDYKSFSSTFGNLTLNLTTEYPYIWGNWFNKTLEKTTLTTPYHYNVSVNATTRTVAVEFYGHVDGVELYLEKTAVEVEIQR